MIGLSLMGVGINWAAGGVGNPDYGNPVYLGLSLIVLMLILLINKFAKGFVANISVLLGIVVRLCGSRSRSAASIWTVLARMRAGSAS